MRRFGFSGKHGRAKDSGKIYDSRFRSLKGRDIIRRTESFRIAPKHPGMGRR